MKPPSLKVHISPEVNEILEHDWFEKFNKLVREGFFKRVSTSNEAHVVITHYPENLETAPQDILHISLYSSTAAKTGLRLICPEELLRKLWEFNQLLVRDSLVHKGD
ncbi:MAG: hypothetical protein RLZZ517_668 [Candidatus Parcubacteria bacterium]|jgi:hypothetical protein